MCVRVRVCVTSLTPGIKNVLSDWVELDHVKEQV